MVADVPDQATPTGAQREGRHARQQVAQAHVVALPGGRMPQQPVAPPHGLRRLHGAKTGTVRLHFTPA